ncbi:glycolate oxidase subunit GlcE [Ensifer sp. SSB1]|uniref:glycolate oxidase subunit GlcE n=1 Tax=Ensifer sp. SSB1 TaxID=2795385 RepID=UPI001A5B5248|nr:glycolate oxidase subunit GlcE [Ensifer sp. SSB1]MBK5568601.1 glycolate oxidase subunit GlcE [Ensifer sp. SSB1]
MTTLIPASDLEAAEMVRAAMADGTPLSVAGGSTRSNFYVGAAARTVLRSTGLVGIVDYEPQEMVMTVRAGTPVAEVEAALAEKRQMMAFEPMDPRAVLGTSGEPTIGGVFAANVSGPRRFVCGAARDGLLGVRFINGRGEAIRAGGRVMKNVTGLDLVKLFAGSHGTLGFMTEVTFRVQPLPAAIETIVVSSFDGVDPVKAMSTAMAMPVEVSGAAYLPASVKESFLGGALRDSEAVVLRLEGTAASVSARAEKLVAAMESLGSTSRLGSGESQVLWREIRDVHPYVDGTLRPLWRISVAPSAGVQLVAALRLKTDVDAYFDWQGGLIWMRMETNPQAELLRRQISALGGGHATLMRTSDAVAAETLAFEPLAPAVAALSARIKMKLDPADIFCPGKMGGTV